ncbi:MAG: aspartyl protease family protein, partial [Phycisphaerae bacterium]
MIVILRTPVISLISLATTLAAIPPATAQHRMMGPDPAPKSTHLSQDSVNVTMHRYHNWPVVEAKVNGRGPYRFIIDTGAPGLFLCDWIANDLQLDDYPGMPSGMQIRVAGPGGGKGLSARMNLVKTLTLGDAEFREMLAISLKLPLPRAIAGVIGMGLLQDTLFTLDYPAGKVTFRRGELPPADGREILNFTQERQRGSHPAIQIDVCGEPVEFVIDSGMTGWFRFDPSIVERCGLAYGPVSGLKGQHADREVDMQVARLGGSLKHGRFE